MELACKSMCVDLVRSVQVWTNMPATWRKHSTRRRRCAEDVVYISCTWHGAWTAASTGQNAQWHGMPWHRFRRCTFPPGIVHSMCWSYPVERANPLLDNMQV